MNYFFFDTETNGAPRRKLPLNHPGQPVILQVAAILTNDNGEIIESFDGLVDNGRDVTVPEFILVKHGITSEKARKEGKPVKDVVIAICRMAALAGRHVAHNIDFDAEMVRLAFACCPPLGYHYPFANEGVWFCTMRSSTDICKCRHPNGGRGYKWPKLEECVRFFFNEPHEKAHDALADVLATKRIFFELKRRGLA